MRSPKCLVNSTSIPNFCNSLSPNFSRSFNCCAEIKSQEDSCRYELNGSTLSPTRCVTVLWLISKGTYPCERTSFRASSSFCALTVVTFKLVSPFLDILIWYMPVPREESCADDACAVVCCCAGAALSAAGALVGAATVSFAAGSVFAWAAGAGVSSDFSSESLSFRTGTGVV